MRELARRRIARPIVLAGATILVAAGLTTVATLPASAATTATVSVNAGQSLATIPDVGVGMNLAVWDGRMNDPVTTELLGDAGITAAR